MKKVTVVLMALFFLFSSSTLAADNSAQVDTLIKIAEKQGTVLSNQLNIKDPKKIKAIHTKTISNLSLAISNAKKALKTNKGKQKTAFEKRVKTLDQLVIHSNSFNAAIAQGEKLLKDGSNFEKSFTLKPFNSEKAYRDFVKQKDVFTKSLGLLSSKETQYSFGVKYQLNLQITHAELNQFFAINKRVDSFLAFTEKNEDTDVWDEFNAIYDSIDESLSDEEMSNLIIDKFYDIYYAAFIAPEEEAIEEYLFAYTDALNARDAEAIVELYPYDTEEDRQTMINKLQATFEKLTDFPKVSIESVDIYFAYNGEAHVGVEEVYGEDGEDSETVELFLKKFKGKWIMLRNVTEETTGTWPATF